ncbi:hypothetical protein LS684_12135 [Cytobacillus spongiae]|uniref:hypothetical protein n=1 Tax=Cytobacillus spongiae TaxID=2901381 RepID=UPI001F17BABA|nr:hypothetical protein [Cytobacillus spongiae]UII54429.1 hypothetical protein LS684_12135 [Cytobacillus spongiae]
MKTSTFLLIIVMMMHFITLTNITIFHGEYNGIALALSTILFISSIAIFVNNKRKMK